MKEWRIEFEVRSPATGRWAQTGRTVVGPYAEADVREQFDGQAGMPDVRNSVILSREPGEWKEEQRRS